MLLRTPISAKYCWFGWWLGVWSTSSHHPTQLCDIYISGYKYTLISEWTRLFGLLRILDNSIAGALCYFCTAISVFCEIYTLRMRVVAHAAIVWVGWFLCRRPELGLYICPHHWCRNPGDLNVLGRSRASVGQVLVPLGRVYRPIGRRHLWGDSVAGSWVPGRVVGCWLQWSACWSRGARGRRCRMGFVWRTVSRNLHVLETARTLGRASWWAQDVGVYVHFVAGVSSVFRGSCLFDFCAPWL